MEQQLKNLNDRLISLELEVLRLKNELTQKADINEPTSLIKPVKIIKIRHVPNIKLDPLTDFDFEAKFNKKDKKKQPR